MHYYYLSTESTLPYLYLVELNEFIAQPQDDNATA
jgi:hypothetical protein